MFAFRFSAILLILLLGSNFLFAQTALPELREPFTDLTSTLTAEEAAALNQQLHHLNQTKGAQLAVVIVSTIEPENIESYSLRLAEKWKLGRKGIDDGVLLLIAKDDRELRIEVGYGLEGVLTDVNCKRIIDEIIVPQFKQNNFNQGIQDGVNQIIKLIEGESLPEPQEYNQEEIPSVAVAAIFFLLFLASILRRLFGRLLSAIIVGGIAGFLLWFFTALLGLSVIGGFLAFVVALSDIGKGLNRYGGYGGSGRSGGGFSGGGGGFGGGGASGRW